MFGEDENVADALAYHAGARADHAAIVHRDETISYGELHQRVLRMAAWVAGQGLRQHETVGVALRDSIDHLVALFAIPRAGMVLLPMDWRWTTDEQARVARHFGARVVLVEPGTVRLDGFDGIALDDTWRRTLAATAPACPYRGGGPLLMSLSSGTTGRPKGPRLTHKQFMRRFLVYWMNLGVNSQDVYLSATPLYFGASRTFAMAALTCGATIHLFPPPFDAEALCDEVARSGATATFLVPTMLRRLLVLPDRSLAAFRGVQRLVSIGASLYPGERESIFKRLSNGFVDYYGSTEGGGSTFLTRHDPAQFSTSVGRPVFGIEVQCVDHLHQPVAPGATGRVRVRGAVVATEFWNDPDASREAFRDGWYYPGDIGAIDAHGYLHLKGRAKDMIIRGGVNIYPADIEAVLQTHPAVIDGAAVGWPSEEFNEEVAAFVILRGNAGAGELREYCRPRLARYKLPREVFVVDDLPRNTLGKVIKADLVARLPLIAAGANQTFSMES